MKLIKLSSYYAPENISSSHLSRDLEDAYLAAGMTIEVHCPTPTRGVSAEERNRYKRIKREELHEGKVIIRRFSMFREGRNPIQRALRYALTNVAQYCKGGALKDIDIVITHSDIVEDWYINR